jgi:hypothetical protein
MVVVTILCDILNPVRLIFSSLAVTVCTIRFVVKKFHIQSHTVYVSVYYESQEEETSGDHYRDFQMCETGMGQ